MLIFESVIVHYRILTKAMKMVGAGLSQTPLHTMKMLAQDATAKEFSV